MLGAALAEYIGGDCAKCGIYEVKVSERAVVVASLAQNFAAICCFGFCRDHLPGECTDNGVGKGFKADWSLPECSIEERIVGRE